MTTVSFIWKHKTYNPKSSGLRECHYNRR